ncbi:F0F1 ATP synthase subunit B [Pseudonocardia sp. RS11V-5]|uniref:F0F1 ATP synthase subunit B n=1 Tax=Pseudonocardia terrae TaxID=2905831 RepID=UPI001E322CB2|nr:F0F1 ATP synthase subunit B [Pseudonocardia terrae]MCE3550391.1 F0F1 ATP synthase subunit B [Pseudonocardia terrae]
MSAIVTVALLALLVFVITGFGAPLGAGLTEVIVGLGCLGLLYFLLTKLVFPQFERLYAEREDRTEGGLARAEETRAQAMELEKQHEDQLADARAEAARIRDAARSEGSEVKAELRAQAEQDAAAIRARAAEEIATQRATAAQALHADLGALSTQMAQRILGSMLPARGSSAIDRHLAELQGSQRSATN